MLIPGLPSLMLPCNVTPEISAGHNSAWDSSRPRHAPELAQTFSRSLRTSRSTSLCIRPSSAPPVARRGGGGSLPACAPELGLNATCKGSAVADRSAPAAGQRGPAGRRRRTRTSDAGSWRLPAIRHAGFQRRSAMLAGGDRATRPAASHFPPARRPGLSATSPHRRLAFQDSRPCER